ncbi:pyrroline-5-carboxylate reductase [Salmonella enterica subsp. enterica serovar Agona str. 0322]|nr:pyrroline-5-carboxylate reductase [Salmonella enterica subsp. enterica serovar Agona str. 0322]CAB3270262.1 unnamed protein product [Salmonella enterica subsp. enterica serovar Typhimurium]
MEKKIGFIGCGNMGKAILGGLIASGQVLPGQIWVYTPPPIKSPPCMISTALMRRKARRRSLRSRISFSAR